MANFIESTIAVISPKWAAKREAERLRLSSLKAQRGYEAAQHSHANTILALNSSSAREVSKATHVLAARAQEICRNNGLALRIKMVWANSIVGKGIKLLPKFDNKRSGKKITTLLDEWAESTDCDFDGGLNLSGLQWLWAATVVETGGVFVRFHVDKQSTKEGKFPLQFQTIEQTYLDKTKNDGDKVVDGIQYDDNGKIEGYWLYVEKTGLNMQGKQESIYYKKDTEIVHIYRKERPGQHLGITWLAQVMLDLDKYATLKEALLTQQQVAACFGVIVKEATQTMGVGTGNNNGKGTFDKPDEIYPNSVYYMKDGQDITVLDPPDAHDSGQFTTNLKTDIATGVNLTYPQLTGDYSKFNFASGRMGKNDFFENLDTAQNNMMLPALMKIGNMISEIMYLVSGAKMKLNWQMPARNTVTPKEDFEHIKDQVRCGMLSPSGAARMLGRRLEDVIEEWKRDKSMWGDLPFDLDPSKFSSAGNQLDQNDAASSNQTTQGGGDE